jgi:hypothetical protein
MKIRSSLALLTCFVALGLAGCAAYPDTAAGRGCRHDREVCGDTTLTVQQCLDLTQALYDMYPACRAQMDARSECLVRSGSAGCGTFIMVCEAELTALRECQGNI